jgi:hypothetical protein
MTLIPNPFSPYADADPAFRHLVPSFFGIAPPPGVLAPAACCGMTVVPDEPLSDATDALKEGRLDDLPEGLCPVCVAVASGQQPHPRPEQVVECRDCGGESGHGDLCALCRQGAHDEWWPTREQAQDGVR